MSFQGVRPKTSPRRWIGLFLKIALALLFIFAGATKAYDPGEFAREISRYELLPWIYSALVSIYLPWLEMLLGMLLLIGKFERGALLIIGALLLLFSGALLIALLRGLDIDCGCFGKAFTSPGTVGPLIRNIVLLVCVGLVWRLGCSRRQSADSLGRG
jgi:putative oxidoreductase